MDDRQALVGVCGYLKGEQDTMQAGVLMFVSQDGLWLNSSTDL